MLKDKKIFRTQSAGRRYSYHEWLQPSEFVAQLRANHYDGYQRSEYVPSPLWSEFTRYDKHEKYFIL